MTCAVLLLPSPAHAAKRHPARHHGHSPRYLVAHRLAVGLRGTPLGPYAFAIERSGHRWHVSPFFIAAISSIESSFGAAACDFNAFGINSCRGYNFRSWPEGIEAEARLLRQGYLDKGSRSLWSIGPIYCPPCGSSWGDHVASVMRSQFGEPPVVTY